MKAIQMKDMEDKFGSTFFLVSICLQKDIFLTRVKSYSAQLNLNNLD